MAPATRFDNYLRQNNTEFKWMTKTTNRVVGSEYFTPKQMKRMRKKSNQEFKRIVIGD
jgi:hypothetical protein